eukprot:1678847-Lingulodinium_polyedra.AAC.1
MHNAQCASITTTAPQAARRHVILAAGGAPGLTQAAAGSGHDAPDLPACGRLCRTVFAEPTARAW